MPEHYTQTIESIGTNLLREIPDHEGYFETPINGLTVINRPVYADNRGSFSEVYNARMR
jgi:dTDP-4-dehydrorhamnose 3,5-epimerase-like enzyme